MKFTETLLFSFLLATFAGRFVASTHVESFFRFHTNVTRCPMFVKFCKIGFAIDKNLNISELVVSDGETRYYRFKSVELCENRTRIPEEECELGLSELNEADKDLFKAGYFFIQPKLVGKAALTVRFRENSLRNDTQDNVRHQIVITSPERIVDKIHLVSMIVLQSVISLIMGILLDVHSIMKIIKMPVPVLAGFFTQYLCMPLVRQTKQKKTLNLI